jgi:hypothetical protein
VVAILHHARLAHDNPCRSPVLLTQAVL